MTERIYRYLLDENLVSQGDTILDCFGGVGLGAFHALQFGLSWLGAELEQNFVELGQENIALWESRYRGKLPNWTGQAVLLQGDSRRLIEVLRQNGIEAVVSSPPYANVDPKKNSSSIDMRKNHASYIAAGGSQSFEAYCRTQEFHSQGYGDGKDNLANLPTGDLKAVVTSSPFAGNSGGRGEASRNGIDAALFDRHQGGMVRGLGETGGNLGAMQPKQSDLKAIVTSSPYADTDLKTGKVNPESWSDGRARNVGVSQEESVGYGDSDGQIGATSGDTFWSAARLILEQCYMLLPEGGAAVFVCKDFVKDWERVPFSVQWAELCQAIGFVPYAHFRAWQVKPGPVQRALVGDDKDYTKEYKSFFRRNREKKGSPKIDWEDVLVFRKEPPNA